MFYPFIEKEVADRINHKIGAGKICLEFWFLDFGITACIFLVYCVDTPWVIAIIEYTTNIP